MPKKKGRGRPRTFDAKERRRLAELIRKHGATRARELAGVPISKGTMFQIAREYGIELKVGRRRH